MSYFSEILRRFFAQKIIDHDKDINENIEKLLPIFSPHLQKLKGMTRSNNDWIIDNFFNPSSLQFVFSIPDAVNALEKDFEFYNQCPNFYVDWRWYKSLTKANRNYNQHIIQQYWENIHSFLDHTQIFPKRGENDNNQLYILCDLFRKECVRFEKERDLMHFEKAAVLVSKVVSEISKFSPKLSKSVDEALTIIKQEHVDDDAFSNIYFANVWGRGQQYLSFIKK